MNRTRGPLRIRTPFEFAAGLALVAAAIVIVILHDSDQRGLADPAAGSEVAAFQNDRDTSVQSASDLRNDPYRLVIPKLGIDAPIVSVETDDDGVLGIPRDPAIVGWWSEGVEPGSDIGTAVLASHANTAEFGPGALHDLGALEPGDELTVSGWSHNGLDFRVESIERYSKSALGSANAFDQAVPGQLALVSCDDLDITTGQYRQNVIVYASPDDS